MVDEWSRRAVVGEDDGMCYMYNKCAHTMHGSYPCMDSCMLIVYMVVDKWAKRRPATHGQSPFWLADQLTKLSAKKRELVNLKAADILAFAAAVIKVLYIG